MLDQQDEVILHHALQTLLSVYHLVQERRQLRRGGIPVLGTHRGTEGRGVHGELLKREGMEESDPTARLIQKYVVGAAADWGLTGSVGEIEDLTVGTDLRFISDNHYFFATWIFYLLARLTLRPGLDDPATHRETDTGFFEDFGKSK